MTESAAHSLEKISARLPGFVLPVMMIVICLIPVWTVAYLPLYDYAPHLMEAQVVLHYEDPDLGYSPLYQIRDGWQLRSNALVTLLLVGLGQWLPLDFAGRIVVSGYFLLLGIGFLRLLHRINQPVWFFWLFPVLAYNFSFTFGLLNWCYGFALFLFLLLGYFNWVESRKILWLFALAALSLLTFSAHVLAWGVGALAILAAASANDTHNQEYWKLGVAFSVPLPLVILAYPEVALVWVVGAASIWMLQQFARRLRPGLGRFIITGVAAAGVFLVFVKTMGIILEALFPGIAYSVYAKLVAVARVFTLPHHEIPLRPELVLYNFILLLLIAILAVVLAVTTTRTIRDGQSLGWQREGLLAASGFLLFVYAVIPTRTADIVATEPRILLLAFTTALFGAVSPQGNWKSSRVLLGAVLLTGVLAAGTVQVYAWRYDQAARRWASALEAIPNRQRLLVLPSPRDLPVGGLYDLLQVAQVFEPDQFTSVYALKKGGFVSNSFFNGPLEPLVPEMIPPYWNIRFRSVRFLEARCDLIREQYDYALVWHPQPGDLLDELNTCFGAPVMLTAEIGLWR